MRVKFRGKILSIKGIRSMDDRGNFRSESRAAMPGVFLLIFLNVFSTLGLISFSNHAYSQEPADGVSIETPVKVEPAKALLVDEIQSQEVQDPPVTIPSVESDQKQDPQDPVVEEDPDEQLRKKVRSFFDSSENSDWVRAMTLLGARLEREDPPQWINPLILEMLTDRALENPVRTRLILQDELITNSNTGILILTVLLRQEANWPFLEEVENSFRKWSLDEVVRDRLITEFRVATDPLQVARLFDVLTVGDPRAVIEAAIDRLRDSAETVAPTILSSLGEFMKLELDQAGWIAWWDANGDLPILDGIVARTEEAGQERELAMWNRADQYLRAGSNPERYLNWLIESMSNTETHRIRSVAISRAGEFSKEYASSDSNGGSENRVRLFRPIVERLISVLQEGSNSARSTAHFQQLALLSLSALREFEDFRGESDLVQILRFHISRLNPDLTNGSRRLAREALSTAMALRAPVSDEVDAAIIRFIPGVDKKFDGAEIRRLVGAARTIGFSENTVGILFRVARLSPPLGAVVLEALVYGQVPQSSVGQVLQYYDELIISTKEANIRSLAINGIGRLGVPEGIPILVSMVLQGAGESEAERGAALSMIGSIGGSEAVSGIVRILGEISSSDTLRESALKLATTQVVRDETLQLAQVFLLNAEGELNPWGSKLLESSSLIDLLRAKGQPTDLRDRDPQRFQRWIQLQARRFEVLVQDFLARTSAGTQSEAVADDAAWNDMKQELVDSLALIGSEPVTGPHAEAVARLRQLAREIDGRAVVSEALGAGAAPRIIQSFTVYLEALTNESGAPAVKSYFSRDPWTWLLDQLEQNSLETAEAELIRALRVLAEERSERETILNRIDALEARSEPIEKETNPAPVEEVSEEPVRE